VSSDALLRGVYEQGACSIHRVVAVLDLSGIQGNYRIENEADEPDPYILDLTADLGECHGVMMSKLPDEDIRQVIGKEIERSLTISPQ
jgi:hypothetical protein